VRHSRVAFRNVAVAMLSLTVSCSLPPETGPSPRAFRQMTGGEAEASRDLRWGLALSGGGIRAAAFSIGAMKAMYDARLLDSIQVISTVSGGTYAAYWLMSRELRVPNERRFAGAFEAPAYRAGTCELFTTGNFFTYGRALKAVFTTRTARGEYNSAILRTFGRVEYDTVKYWTKDSLIEVNPIYMHSFQDAVRARQLPHWIINSTVVKPKPDSGWSMGLNEMTPFMHGNETEGYAPWTSGDSFPVRRSVAISGAAYRPGLKQRVQLGDRWVTLADGGGSENLGAIALVRRRVKNIVIIDAEHDPNYKLGAYTNLRDRLKHWGDSLHIESLEKYILPGKKNQPRLEAAIHVGTVTSKTGGYVGNVYYVKMSVPVTMDSALTDEAVIDVGRRENNRVVKVLEDTKTPAEDRWHCAALASDQIDLTNFYLYQISLFVGRERRDHGKLSLLAGDYPQYRTIDQSFNINRTNAFVGLGYLVTKDLQARIRR
jgi:hypothetical protein